MIEIKICNRIARVVGSPQIICGNSDYVVAFQFDSEWDASAEKTAVFSYVKDGKREKKEVTFTGTVCYAPVLNGIDRVEIGVFCGDIRTTTPAMVPCGLSISDYKSEATQPQNDVYNDLMEQKALAPFPELEDDEYFVMTLDGDYVCTSSGDYVIAKG